MKKIIFIVSSLKKSGPTNQLSYIISNLNPEIYDCRVLTLSPESTDSNLSYFNDLGVVVDSLSLSRFSGVIFGKHQLMKYINKYSPDIIQTQGIRADSLVCSLKVNIPWITTARNFPFEDYPTKFGKLKGYLMAYKHFSVLSKCVNLVSCSNSIQQKLHSRNIKSRVIHNGVPITPVQPFGENRSKKNRIITVGSLIPRKNVHLLIESFNSLTEYELLVLGDGPERKYLESIASDNIKFLGNVNNVKEYLSISDAFISSSFSEGLPNAVLEAAAVGTPVILSDIGPHKEISDVLTKKTSFLFPVDILPSELSDFIFKITPDFLSVDREVLINKTKNNFSSEEMSNNYQKLYKECYSGS